MPATGGDPPGNDDPRLGGRHRETADAPAGGFGMLTRDELLGGLPARRASTLLFAIESRTAHLVARSRRAMARHLTERTAEEQERAFLDALAQGRDLPLRPTIQDLERYAPEWASLVPDDDALRASLARMLGERYVVPAGMTAGIRQALGLDDPNVGAAFERLHGQPLPSIYAAELPLRERVRWLRSRAARRLETLPPFWTAFALTLTETVGAGILALPIALAEVGPVAGLVAIVVLGLVNVLTIAAMSEAVARNGNVRYGQAYFGRLVSDYLGGAAAWILAPAFTALGVISLLAYYIGFSSTLADATAVPSVVWAGVMFVLTLSVLRRESLDATVASALAVGAASIGLILLLCLITLPSVTGENLRHATIPFLDGQPFEASLLELVFGVVLLAFFGHTSTGNCAAVVLRRDTTARSFIWGSVAATACAMALYSLWVFAVNGAVPAARLVGESGTALTPLADEIGPAVHVLGSVFVVLAMGMGAIHMSLGLFNQVREWFHFPLRPSAPARGRGWQARLRGLFGGGRQFWVGVLPVAAVFLLVEGLFAADRESFTGPLGFLGTLTVPLLGGVFPMLMVAASRRKGDSAVGLAWRLVGHPAVVIAAYALFLAALLLHGLVLWEAWYQRLAAVLVSGVVVAVTLLAFRRGAFRPRTVVEVRSEPDAVPPTLLNVVFRGEPVRTEAVPAGSGDAPDDWGALLGGTARGARPIHLEVPTSPAGDLKVWTHRITPEGSSEHLPATLVILNGDTISEYDLGASAGQVIVPVSQESQRLEIRLK